MSTVNIRKSSVQSGGVDFVNIEARLVTDIDTSSADVEIGWSFESQDEDTMLLHSGDAYENQYLNYADPLNPTLQIILPDDNDHTIVVKAQIKQWAMRDVPIAKLDENDEPYEVIETLWTPEITTVESQPLTIHKIGLERDWL